MAALMTSHLATRPLSLLFLMTIARSTITVIRSNCHDTGKIYIKKKKVTVRPAAHRDLRTWSHGNCARATRLCSMNREIKLSLISNSCAVPFTSLKRGISVARGGVWGAHNVQCWWYPPWIRDVQPQLAACKDIEVWKRGKEKFSAVESALLWIQCLAPLLSGAGVKSTRLSV